jgi:ribosomal protein S18 acetylase RimI-like enzyme
MMEDLQYLEIDVSWQNRMTQEWGQKVASHLRFSDGFTIIARHDQKSVGLISVYWRILPPPLADVQEGYINIIEVRKAYRRRGIATELIALAARRAAGQHACQLRAWSSEDKREAILMWKRLGFGLCPAVTFPGGKEVRGYFVTKVFEH